MAQPTTQEIREEEENLLRQLRAGLNDPALMAMGKLLELRIRKCQEKMLGCPHDEFPAIQEEAKTMAKLLRELRKK